MLQHFRVITSVVLNNFFPTKYQFGYLVANITFDIPRIPYINPKPYDS